MRKPILNLTISPNNKDVIPEKKRSKEAEELYMPKIKSAQSHVVEEVHYYQGGQVSQLVLPN